MKKQWLAVALAIAVAVMTFVGCGEARLSYEGEMAPMEKNEAEYSEINDYSGDTRLDEKDRESTSLTDREVKLVYTCNMTVETLEYKKCVDAVRALVTKYDGFVENESEYDEARNWYYSDYQKTSATMRASFTVRIPTKNYDAFLGEMEGNGKVTQRTSNVQNITKKYYETATSIQSLEIQEERLLKMMEEAKDINEMLAIEDRLTDVQSELAQYKNALASMDTDVDYSTVTLSIREVVEYTPDQDPVKTNTFGDRLKNTFKETWEGLKEFGENLLFFLIQAGPYLLIFIVIPLIILLALLKKAKKNRAAKKAQKQAAEPLSGVKEETK